MTRESIGASAFLQRRLQSELLDERVRAATPGLTYKVNGVRERVESARDELLKRPRALEGTSVAAMDVARSTKIGSRDGSHG